MDLGEYLPQIIRNGSLHYNLPAGGTLAHVRGYVESLSSATAHAEVVITPTINPPNTAAGTPNAGVIMVESGTGKILHFMAIFPGFANNQIAPTGILFLQAAYWASSSSLTAYANITMPMINGPLFMGIARSGTNTICRISVDGGQNWKTVYTIATTTAFTTAPDQSGVAGIANNAADSVDVNLLYSSGA